MKEGRCHIWGSSFIELIKGKRVVILGIGNELRGDDGAGILFVRMLSAKSNGFICHDCGTAPENFIGLIRREKPDLVIFVDAVEFDGEAGDVIVVEPDRAIGPISTHYLPLSVMAGVLRNENIDSILIGFRPSSSNLGECPSEAVKRSVEGVVDILIDG